jgi:hypothetical protein
MVRLLVTPDAIPNPVPLIEALVTAPNTSGFSLRCTKPRRDRRTLSGSILTLDVGRLDDEPPFFDFGLVKGAEATSLLLVSREHPSDLPVQMETSIFVINEFSIENSVNGRQP